MVIKQSHDVEKSEDFSSISEMSFGIDDSNLGFIFELLRSKIYQDPIASITREVISNCRDAHREVDSKEAPVVKIITNHPLVSLDSPTIIFQDFGPGITPDRMADVFCKYASSTKRDTNQLTGGFGLGAKTPFAYSDTFWIITRVENVERTYLSYIDNTKVGKIELVEEKECVESNGTQIVIPVKKTDLDYFQSSLISQTCWWTTKPKLINFKHYYPSINVQRSEPGWSYDSCNFYQNKVVILIDEIAYPLNHPSLPSSIPGGTLVLKFKNGDLDVSANRETLHYTDDTIAKIKESIDSFKKNIEKEIFDYIEASTSLIDFSAKVALITNGNTNNWSKLYSKDSKLPIYRNWYNWIGNSFLKGITWKDKHPVYEFKSQTLFFRKFDRGYFEKVSVTKDKRSAITYAINQDYTTMYMIDKGTISTPRKNTMAKGITTKVVLTNLITYKEIVKYRDTEYAAALKKYDEILENIHIVTKPSKPVERTLPTEAAWSKLQQTELDFFKELGTTIKNVDEFPDIKEKTAEKRITLWKNNINDSYIITEGTIKISNKVTNLKDLIWYSFDQKPFKQIYEIVVSYANINNKDPFELVRVSKESEKTLTKHKAINAEEWSKDFVEKHTKEIQKDLNSSKMYNFHRTIQINFKNLFLKLNFPEKEFEDLKSIMSEKGISPTNTIQDLFKIQQWLEKNSKFDFNYDPIKTLDKVVKKYPLIFQEWFNSLGSYGKQFTVEMIKDSQLLINLKNKVDTVEMESVIVEQESF